MAPRLLTALAACLATGAIACPGPTPCGGFETCVSTQAEADRLNAGSACHQYIYCPAPDAGRDAADASFACGPQPGLTCEPTQYCLVGCTDEGPIICTASLDSGACPVGTSWAPKTCGSVTNLCETDPTVFPSACLDAIDAATSCPNPDTANASQTRMLSCNCSL